MEEAKMITLFKKYHLNIVAYPKNTEVLEKVQNKIRGLFPSAQVPEEAYRFPLVIYHKEISQGVGIGRLKKLLSGSSKDMTGVLRVQKVIVDGNYLLLSYTPVDVQTANLLDALNYMTNQRYPGEAVGDLLMPLVWLPQGMLFTDDLLENILQVLCSEDNPLDIEVDFKEIEIMPTAGWKQKWEEAFSPRKTG